MRCNIPRWFGIECRGYRPVTAFTVSAVVSGLSTATAVTVVRFSHDKQSISYWQAFFIVVALMMAMNLVLESALFFCCAWGGGSLATRGMFDNPTTDVYWNGPSASTGTTRRFDKTPPSVEEYFIKHPV